MEGLNLRANVSLWCKKKKKESVPNTRNIFKIVIERVAIWKDRRSTKFHSRKLITYALGVYVHLPWSEYYDGEGSSIKKEKRDEAI